MGHPIQNTGQIEEWREIIGFNGYQVSNLGRVRTLLNSGGPRPRKLRKEPRILKLTLGRGGYLFVGIYSNEGIQVAKIISRTVLETFVGPPPEQGFHANHLNQIRQDNRLANLEWATPSENRLHIFRNGCLRGHHELRTKGFKRICPVCDRERSRKYRANKIDRHASSSQDAKGHVE